MSALKFLIKGLKKIRNDENGLETVEMAISLPILLFVVLFGMVFLLAIYSKIIVIDSAREAARAEALGYATASEKVEEIIEGGSLKTANIVVVDVESDVEKVEVEVQYDQPSIIPLLPQLIGGDAWGEFFRLKSKSVFKKESP